MKCIKVGYRKRSQAHHAMRTIARIGKEMREYLCPYCFQYHLTSDLKNKDDDGLEK